MTQNTLIFHKAAFLSESYSTLIEPMAYRVATYFMLTMIDDPAMLALIFC